MGSHIGSYVRDVRERRNFTFCSVVRGVGYRNVNKGIRRLQTLEREGQATPAFFKSVCVFLDLDLDRVNECIVKDRMDRLVAHTKWLIEPIPWKVSIPLWKSTRTVLEIPSYVRTIADLYKFAEDVAQNVGRDVTVLVSRREEWTVSPDGGQHIRPPVWPEPGVYLRGKRIGFLSEIPDGSFRPKEIGE